ncbi:hypothetical protein CEK26_009191 [Fusarium fujikuroi]|nr:hypothetical protein CEK27_009211 [Fusarium fujikuroi]QGI82489.1 hypothetical protein CEK25_009218 [Fusarium fujikuroi]QGI96122.1 hypothetical protein CEK26_009191 [Fusarium fujikuroi]
MKLASLIIVCLPAVSANYPWWTNSGWSKPADHVSGDCAADAQYFCGTISGTRGENPEPNAFPIRRYTCSNADTLGRGCNWQGAVGVVNPLR